MTEYWLQNKTIGGWSTVTWYDSQEQAKINYDRLRQAVGYSYRMVKVEAIEVNLLEEVVELKPSDDIEVKAKANVWGGNKGWAPINEISGGWGDKPSGAIVDNGVFIPAVPEHGMTGKVWLINHADKSRVRVAPDEVQRYIDGGYERGGPKTAFRE